MTDIIIPTNATQPLDDLLDAFDEASVEYERSHHPRAVNNARDAKNAARAALVDHFAESDSANRDERAAWSRCYAILTGDSGAYTLADLERAVKDIVARHREAVGAIREARNWVPDGTVTGFPSIRDRLSRIAAEKLRP